MPGKGKGKQKKKQQPQGQASKAVKTVKQPEENEFDSDIDNTDELDVEADDDTVGTVGQEDVIVKSKVQEDKQASLKDTQDMLDKTKLDDHVVEENGAVGSSPSSEKKLTRKEMKKMKKKACVYIIIVWLKILILSGGIKTADEQYGSCW